MVNNAAIQTVVEDALPAGSTARRAEPAPVSLPAMVPGVARRDTVALVTHAARIVLLAALYVMAARVGLRLGAVSGFATLVWPPTGLSLAAVLLFGRKLWPGIALGALVVNVWNGAPIPVALGIAVGNTLEALVGAYALRRIPGFRVELDRLRDVLGLIVLAALGSTVVSATMGVASLYAGGLVSASRIAETWVAWWLGDAIGDLVVAPFLLAWITAPWKRASAKRLTEGLALGAAILGTSLVLFGSDTLARGVLTAFRQPTTLLPLFIWAALRFGPPGVTGATVLVSAVAVSGTALGHGPFVRAELHDSLALLQGFMSVVAVTFLVLSAVTAEQERADRDRVDLFHRERLARAHAEDLQRLGGQAARDQV